MRSCLPTSTTSSSLVGFESRSTMLPASLAAWVPVFMATPTSAWASAGASLVPSPVMATSLPLACSSWMSRILASGVASARKSSTPASRAMAAAVRGLSPVIMTVRMPMARKRSNRSLMPPFTTSFRWTMPSTRGAVGDRQRRAPGVADAAGAPPPPRRACRRPGRPRAARPRRPPPSQMIRPSRSQPLMRVCAREGDEACPGSLQLAAAEREVLLGQHHDGAPLRRLVGQAGELGRVGQVLHPHAGRGDEARRPSGCRA